MGVEKGFFTRSCPVDMLVYSSQQRLEDLKTHSTGQGDSITAPDIVGVDVSDRKVLVSLLETENHPKKSD